MGIRSWAWLQRGILQEFPSKEIPRLTGEGRGAGRQEIGKAPTRGRHGQSPVCKLKVRYIVLYSSAHFWEIMSFESFTVVLPMK